MAEDDGSVVTRRQLAPAAIITRHAAALLDNSVGAEGTLDFRLRRFAAEKEELKDRIKALQVGGMVVVVVVVAVDSVFSAE